jgi:hypothetical protein
MMSGDRPKTSPSYSVTVKHHGRNSTWTWEILRTPELGVRLCGENFNSEQAAKLAGEKALHTLLEGLANEASNA